MVGSSEATSDARSVPRGLYHCRQFDGHVEPQEAAKATAALVVGKRRRKKADYTEPKLADLPAEAASDGEGGAGDPPSDADCVPTQDASSDSDSDSDDEGGQVRDR